MDITIRDFEERDADELVRVWRTSFEKAVGVLDPNPLEEQRRFLVEQLAPSHTIRVVWAQDRIVGFIAVTPDSISQLYLAEEAQGQGIGRQLVDWAKAQSVGMLWLYAFESNTGAQAFYEKCGFHIVARGFEPVLGLNDIKYEWRREP